MKLPSFVVLAFLVCVSSLRLQADEVLVNGDFSEGINQWKGNGEDVAQAAPELAVKGILIRLQPREWTKVTQDFRPVGTNFDCSVTFKLSPDCQFSDKDDDYKNIPNQIGYGMWSSFDISKGTWMMMVSDFGSSTGIYSELKSNPGADGTTTFQTTLLNLTSRDKKTITLAFPPGHGSVVILNVSMTTVTQPVIADTPDFSITGGDATIQKLDNGAKAFSDKDFVWQGLPESLIGQRYTQGAADTHPQLTVHVKNDTTLQVITSTDLRGQWVRELPRFFYTDAHKTPMFLYHLRVYAGHDLVIPQEGKSGVLVLLPN